ncbi:MAG: ABC transporter permease [Actinobacteria bacterium]|nr:ABC transporter permease [Actinomycetota bacterium]
MRRRRRQFLAVGVTVVIGVMMFAATYDSYRNLEVSYQRTYDRLAFADMTITGGDESLAASLAAIPGVRAVTVRHTADLPVTIGAATLRGRFIGMPTDEQPDVDKIQVQRGSYLLSGGANEAIAEDHIANTYGLQIGDPLTVAVGQKQKFTITGVAVSAEYLWPAPSTQESFIDPKQFGVFFVDEELLKQLPQSVAVRQTLVLYDKGVVTKDVDAAVRAAATRAGATNILTRADQPSNKALQLDVDMFAQMAIAFPILFLTAAGMAVYVLLTRIVFAQRSIIGTLRASGMSARALRRHYLGYGLRVGTVGAIVGVILGVAFGAWMTGLYTRTLDIPDTIVRIRPITMFIGLTFGIVMGAVSAWIPARAAYRIPPAEAMRGITPSTSGGESLMERILPRVSRLPVRTRMTLRGIGRAKRRSLTTVLGVVLALILIVAAGEMLVTTNHLIAKQFKEITLQDASVIVDKPVDKELLAAIDAVPGVAGAEQVAGFDVSITRDGTTFATTLQGFEDNTQMHGWTNPSGALPPSGMLAAKLLKDRLGLSPGDRITISIPAQDVSIELELVGFVDEPLGTPLYARHDVIAKALREAGVDDPETVMAEPTVATVMTRFDPAAGRTATLAALKNIPGVVYVEDSRTLFNVIKEEFSLFDTFIGIMFIFGSVMAFSLMFNTISVNVAERSTEFATLKASGISDRTIAWMIVGENLLLTAAGIIPGIVLGVWISGLLMATFNSDAFNFELTTRPLTLLLAAVSILVIALLSLIPGIRSIKRLDIAAVVRERSV